jgi:hypothetical protein
MTMLRSPILFASLLAGAGLTGAALPAAEEKKPADKARAVVIELGKEFIDFRRDKDLTARYHVAPAVAKPYFWPLHSPGGVAITRAWPMVKDAPGEKTDHVHQKSAWFCHGDVIPEGIELKQKVKGVEGVDFWAESPGHGRIVVTKVGTPEMSGNHAKVATHNEWQTADGVKILDEERDIHFYDLGPAQLFVLDIDLHASVCPITFGDTKEGSLGVRVREALTEQGGKGVLKNAEGLSTEGKKNNVEMKGCWGMVSAWCDYSGPVEDKTVGVTIFADPKNPSPSCWHSRAYGLMAANPFGRDKSGFPAMKGKKDLVKLAKGEHLMLRYGILVHDGDATSGKVPQLYEEFVKLAK